MVPNQFPPIESPYRIALIGEAPGADEEKEGRPFVGASGRFLAVLLSRAGTNKEACFLGNVCQVKPDHNEIASFSWEGPEIQSGLAQLIKDLTAYQPNIIVALGGAPLHFLKCGTSQAPRKVKKQGRLTFKWLHPPTVWRGSLFSSSLNGTKAIATVHPAYVLRDYSMAPLLQFDLKKAVREGITADLSLPVRNFAIKYDSKQVLDLLSDIKRDKQAVAIDIEGGINSMSCISFALSKGYAFIVPFFFKGLNPY
jgi:uracil-DNA glycosylase family 4